MWVRGQCLAVPVTLSGCVPLVGPVYAAYTRWWLEESQSLRLMTGADQVTDLLPRPVIEVSGIQELKEQGILSRMSILHIISQGSM